MTTNRPTERKTDALRRSWEPNPWLWPILTVLSAVLLFGGIASAMFVGGLVAQMAWIHGAVLFVAFGTLALLQKRREKSATIDDEGLVLPDGERLPFEALSRPAVLTTQRVREDGRSLGEDFRSFEAWHKKRGRLVVRDLSDTELDLVRQQFGELGFGVSASIMGKWHARANASFFVLLALVPVFALLWPATYWKLFLLSSQTLFWPIALLAFFLVPTRRGRAIVHADGVELRSLWNKEFLPFLGLKVGEDGGAIFRRRRSLVVLVVSTKKLRIAFLDPASKARFLQEVSQRRAAYPNANEEMKSLTPEEVGTRIRVAGDLAYRDTGMRPEDLANLAAHGEVPVHVRVAATKALLETSPEMASDVEPKLRASVNEELRELADEVRATVERVAHSGGVADEDDR